MPALSDDPVVHDLDARGRVLPTGSRCLVMGVVNVTPDSFSDGGRHLDPGAAVRHGRSLAAEGADIIDVGGESTRPGAGYIDAATELARVIPVVEELSRGAGVPVSVDTRKAVVARAALDAGAAMVNDVSAGRDDPALLEVVAEAGVPLVLMHMRGTPATMQDDPRYDDVVAEVEAFLAARCAAAEAAGVASGQLVVDPGIGFGKRDEHNYALLGGIARLTRLGHPVLVGVSRKGFIGRALGAAVDQRLEGTEAAVAWVVERGARIVRVHDVAPIRRIVRMTEALMGGLERATAGGSSTTGTGAGPPGAGDRIRLTGLRVFAHHGALPHEAELGQVFVIDVDAGLDLGPAGRTDDLAMTLDYGRLAAEVAELVASRRRRLIEAVAEDVAAHVLAHPGVSDVRVRVAKPHAPIPADATVSVEVARSGRRAGGPARPGATTGPPSRGGEPRR